MARWKTLEIDEIKNLVTMLGGGWQERHKVLDEEWIVKGADDTESRSATYRIDNYLVYINKRELNPHSPLPYYTHTFVGKTHSTDRRRAWNVAYRRLLDDIDKRAND